MCALLGCAAVVQAADTPVANTPAPLSAASPKHVVVIPVKDKIARPLLYVLRRGLKEAIDQKADVVVLDMKTPGGALNVTLEIMEALGKEKFPGITITYVNDQAYSAGAYIAAVTDEIWFSPRGKIGAAAPVSSDGKDIDKTMMEKVVSVLKAEVRSVSEGKGYRGRVISAMIDENYELEIDDVMIKPKGELLTLTATEANTTYGTPPQPLLAAGIAKDIDALLVQKFGAGGYTVKTLEITWSERLAVMLNAISPVLLGLGIMALYMEFKTPGFGIFGIAGISLLVIVFLGNFVAGLSGHEPLLVFAVGVLLVALEIFFLPGTVVMALTGIVLMLGSLLWSMADIWPNQPVELSGDMFVGPMQKMLLALLIAGGLVALLVRFLPHTLVWNRLAVGGAVAGAGVTPAVTDELASLVGREGVAATTLFPSGQVEIDGRRYEARLEVGFAEAGTPIRVVRRTDFSLIVEVQKS
ncbi:MAG: NfeD family protein [Opitutaceae bacterium]